MDALADDGLTIATNTLTGSGNPVDGDDGIDIASITSASAFVTLSGNTVSGFADDGVAITSGVAGSTVSSSGNTYSGNLVMVSI